MRDFSKELPPGYQLWRGQLMTFSSKGEDLLLQRVFADIDNGFYIDVGAYKPVPASNTYALYRRGWHGLIVEPLIGLAPFLEEAWRDLRPRDCIIGAMAASTSGQRPFWVGSFKDTPGVVNLAAQGSTGCQPTTEQWGDAIIGEPVMVQAFSLNEILAAATATQRMEERTALHLLCIDAEGMEEDILLGIDLKKYRPWVMVVEARRPSNIPIKSIITANYEPYLLSNGYLFMCDDGLNGFYLAKEHAELTDKFHAAS